MNERIIELAEQSGLEYNFDPMIWLKYEKFAELIVRECIRLCDQVDIVGADECIDSIKEHFGARWWKCNSFK